MPKDQDHERAVRPPERPPHWKLATLTWLGIFPLATAVFAVADPWIAGLPVVARTFLLSAVLAPTMVFVIMPLLNRAFRSWLQGARIEPLSWRKPAGVAWRGIAAAIAAAALMLSLVATNVSTP